MLVTYDPEVDASYVRVSEGAIVSTDSFTDLLAVDLDAAGVPVGLEVLKAPGAVTSADEAVVTDRYPTLRDAFEALRRIAQPA
ncbi:DUF2283 domain-containing protein [Acidiferrimicrobium sp. IK]|uniref:DUF2283 domain-containing protein n=1 Tax=Acidiferrimicrobium sp. IK TaxID=2871700 RepID=UPI0021CB33C7|nr:DUF2283 domain-containing protein [Acidiferrimicrobium sp. IK]MCU4183520.1 DUF2283 domain-containing protein [Acidiferrimicrobium sp. IK]